jgi:predicted PolB exonuclease-like 3'-5' exonuclease
MSYFILDIETRPNEEFLSLFESEIKPDGRIKDPGKQAEYKSKKAKETYHKSMSVDTDFCKVVCVGIKEISKPGQIIHLHDLEDWFQENTDFKLITFNGKAFDLPIIIKAGIREGNRFPYKVLSDMTKKYQDNGHCDLLQLISFNSSLDKVKKLDTYLQKETLGDDFFRNATDDDLKKHCLQDLELTEELFLKFSFLLK